MKREILFEYGFQSVNGIVKKQYYLHEIPNIKEKCDVWNVLPIVYVRQFTGLTDKNGTKIFEGDTLIVVMTLRAGKPITKELEVYFHKGSFCIDWDFKGSFNSLLDFSNSVTLEVIGNIHENK